jgi:hypothetical protein
MSMSEAQLYNIAVDMLAIALAGINHDPHDYREQAKTAFDRRLEREGIEPYYLLRRPPLDPQVGDAVYSIGWCMEDALKRMNEVIAKDWQEEYPHHRLEVSDLEYHTWTQGWGDTTGAFGGIGGQTMTSMRCLVFVDEALWAGGAVVYHGSRFCRHVKLPNRAFNVAVHDQKLPGLHGGWMKFERKSKDEPYW